MATLTVTQTTDFRGAPAEVDITDIVFQPDDPSVLISATFEPAQFGVGLISDSVSITADPAADQALWVIFPGAGSFSAAGWTFTNWNADDRFSIQGTAADETIIGSSTDDWILGMGGADQIDGGAGNDTFQITPIAAGLTVEGGAGDVDRILIGAFGTTDLKPAEISGVERLAFTSTGQTVIIGGDQIGSAGRFTVVEADPGETASLEVQGDDVDLAAMAFVNWDSDDTITIRGTSTSANELVGSNEDDIFIGTLTSIDFMTGGGGADTLNGGDGPDVFLYAAGADAVAGEVLSGGTSTDIIALTNAGSIDFRNVVVTDVESLDFVSGNSAATVASSHLGSSRIATVSGSSGVDALVVTVVSEFADLSGVNFVDWTAGIDTITINGSDFGDIILGSDQNDTIIGGLGADPMFGGDGNDTYLVDNTGDTANESTGSGTDLVQSTVGFTLDSGVENLTLTGNAAIDGTGNDLGNVITGNSAANTLAGLGGDDTLAGGGGIDTASYAGAAGGVTVALGITTAQNTGGAGLDTLSSIENLIGSNFVDTLSGTSGENAIFGGGNNDDVKGYAGNDTLNGDNGDDTLNGGASNDTLNGGENNDTLIGQDGNDTLAGGNGIDTASYVEAIAGVTVALATTTAQNTVGDGTDTLSSMENLIGSSFADTLSGTSGENTISGGGNTDNVKGFAGNDILNGDNGDDTLNGGANDDMLNGGENNDTLIGQDGNDTLVGGNGTDTASYVGAVAAVTVALSVAGVQNTVGDGTDTLSSIENLIGSNFADTLSGTSLENTISGGGNSDNVKGFAGNDVLNGDAGDDTLNGGANNDTLNGGENNDTLIGQDGNDTLAGGSGIDTASYVGAVAGVTISLATTTAQNTVGDGTDTLSSIENLIGSGFADTLNGTSGDNTISAGSSDDAVNGFSGLDVLNGDNGNDTLNGGANSDTLNGGANDDDLIGQDGDDTLAGGSGLDDFIFDDGHGADTVTDFQNGTDQFDLTAVTGIDDIGDLTIIDNGATVTVNYGSGSFTITNLADPAFLDAGDFIF